jgi:hypothetical protein
MAMGELLQQTGSALQQWLGAGGSQQPHACERHPQHMQVGCCMPARLLFYSCRLANEIHTSSYVSPATAHINAGAPEALLLGVELASPLSLLGLALLLALTLSTLRSLPLPADMPPHSSSGNSGNSSSVSRSQHRQRMCEQQRQVAAASQS